MYLLTDLFVDVNLLSLSVVSHNRMERKCEILYNYCQRFFVVDGPRDEVAKSTRFPPVPTQHPVPHYGTSFSS